MFLRSQDPVSQSVLVPRQPCWQLHICNQSYYHTYLILSLTLKQNFNGGIHYSKMFISLILRLSWFHLELLQLFGKRPQLVYQQHFDLHFVLIPLFDWLHAIGGKNRNLFVSIPKVFLFECNWIQNNWMQSSNFDCYPNFIPFYDWVHCTYECFAQQTKNVVS